MNTLKFALIALLCIVPPRLHATFAGKPSGVTVNSEGTTMYYVEENSGSYTLFKAERDASGKWLPGIAEDSFNRHLAGHVVKTPFLTCDGRYLYFSSNLPGSKGLDIFRSKRTGKRWGSPERVSVINSEHDDLSPSLPANNLRIYFTRQNPETGCFSIHVSKAENLSWSFPQLLPSPINSGCEPAVYVFPAGETILFSSDRYAEKRRKKYTILRSSMLSENLWTPPVPVEGLPDENCETPPAFDFGNNAILLANGRDSIHSREASSSLPPARYTFLKGRTTDETGAAVESEITLREAGSGKVRGRTASDSATGEYLLIIPNDGLYVAGFEKKFGTRRYMNLNTSNNGNGQTENRNTVLAKDFTLNIAVRDALSGEALEPDITVYNRNKSALLARLGEGRFRVTSPVPEGFEVEIRKRNYIREIIEVNPGDCIEYLEIFRDINLKPDLCAGTVNVTDLASNHGIEARVSVKNLDGENEKIFVSNPGAGRYEFEVRKDKRYSISIATKDKLYYYTVWEADADRVSRVLDVKPVPLNEAGRIPTSSTLFADGESSLLTEAFGELACICETLIEHPDYKTVVSLCHANETDRELALMRARTIAVFMDTYPVPKNRYGIEQLQCDTKKSPEINFLKRQ
jgi:hypothetical protein